MSVFPDASYFLALYNEDDAHHKQAAILAKKIDANEYGQIITSDYIFDEVGSVALRKFGKEKAQTFGKQVLESALMINGNKHLFNAAFRIFTSSELPFSFTDCMSQAILNLAQIEYIATFDKLFEKLNVKVLH